MNEDFFVCVLGKVCEFPFLFYQILSVCCVYVEHFEEMPRHDDFLR